MRGPCLIYSEGDHWGGGGGRKHEEEASNQAGMEVSLSLHSHLFVYTQQSTRKSVLLFFLSDRTLIYITVRIVYLPMVCIYIPMMLIYVSVAMLCCISDLATFTSVSVCVCLPRYTHAHNALWSSMQNYSPSKII